MKNFHLKLILPICCIGFVSIYYLSKTNNYSELLKLNQAAMAYYGDYEIGFGGYYSDTDLDGDGIDELSGPGVGYDVRGHCPASDNDCLWRCECGLLYYANLKGIATNMKGTCFCGHHVQ